MEAFKERKAELEKKELFFKNSIFKYEQFLKVCLLQIHLQTNRLNFVFFLKENDIKLRRAVKKADEEKESQINKQRELDRLAKEVEQSTIMKETLSNLVSKAKVFPNFLENVIFKLVL